MKRHIISKTDLEDFETITRLAGHHCKGINKSLDMKVNPVNKRIWFEVSDFRTVISAGPELDDAIDTYNNI